MWISNNPEATARLRAADRAFDETIAEIVCLPLAAKIEAIRLARSARQDAYNAEMRIWES